MLTARCVHRCGGTSERKQYLPVDLLLEIIARSEVTTVVRCAATSRILRRAILGPAFLRRLTADGGGFHPTRLFGVSYRATNIHAMDVHLAHRFIHTLPSAQPRGRLDPSSVRGLFEPVASRDGLLLVSRGHIRHVELRVCDTLTGHATPLPQIDMSYTYGHVFLSVGYAGESYELVVADLRMRFQTFSSEHDQWGPIRQVSITGHDANRYRPAARCPAVIGRTVYWPYGRYGYDNSVCWDRILAMDVDAAEGTIMEFPPGCLSRMMATKKNTHLLLASVCGSLSLLVVESDGISMWKLTPASPPQSTATWSRQLLISTVEIEKVVPGLVDYTIRPFVLEGFGESSGAVIVRVGKGDLLRLDLGSKLVKRLHNEGDVSITGLFLHETADLVSLLQAMKYF